MSAREIPEIPEKFRHLLDRPLYGTLAVVSPLGLPLASPMWFEMIDGTLQFTHTSKRAKYRALQKNPAMSFVIYDPERPIHYAEVRGTLIETKADPTGAFYQRLARRYGKADTSAPADAADRVVLVMSIERVLGQ